jgi:hypothetical protein
MRIRKSIQFTLRSSHSLYLYGGGEVLRRKGSVMILLYYFIVFGVAYGQCHISSVRFLHPSRGIGGYVDPEMSSSSSIISQEDIGEFGNIFYSEIIMKRFFLHLKNCSYSLDFYVASYESKLSNTSPYFIS